MEARIAPVYPKDMVKIAVDDEDLNVSVKLIVNP